MNTNINQISLQTTGNTTNSTSSTSSSTTVQQPALPPPPPLAVIGLHYDTNIQTLSSSSSTTTISTNINISNVESYISNAIQKDGYDFITCQIPDTITTTTTTGTGTTTAAAAATGITSVDSKWWRTSIVGVFSSSTTITNTTTNTSTNNNSTMMITKERLLAAMEWCIHMNIPAIILPSLMDYIDSVISVSTTLQNTTTTTTTTNTISTITRQHITIYANMILSCLQVLSKSIRDLQIWIPYIPLNSSSMSSTTSTTLELFQYLYQLLDYHPNIYTLYTLSSEHNSSTTNSNTTNNIKTTTMECTIQQTIQQIHVGMMGSIPPLAAIQIPTHLFILNKRGFPTLSKYYQLLVSLLYYKYISNTSNTNNNKDTIKLLVTQTMSYNDHQQMYPSTKITVQQLGYSTLLPHLQYLHHLRTTKIHNIITTPRNSISSTTTTTNTNTKLQDLLVLEQEYNDILQVPLQPLSDHLENYTYEIFEQDPIKYVQYETAIYYTILQYYTDTITNTNNNNNNNTMMDVTDTPTIIETNTKGTSVSSITTTSINDQNIDNNNLNTRQQHCYIVLVVGAGRGPLVTCTINAYEKFLLQIQQQQNIVVPPKLYVYAIEKNPNAILYLQSKFAQYIQQQLSGISSLVSQYIELKIVQSDLRYLNAPELFQNIPLVIPYNNNNNNTTNPLTSRTSTTTIQQGPTALATTTPYKANLIVSELLGSFGCNELSPECLDTLFHQTNICTTTTKSIPYHYTSHITPISSIKLYNKVKQQSLFPINMTDYTQQGIIGYVKACETPYVVRPHMASQIYPTQDCWSFTHPNTAATTKTNTNSIDHHERYVHLEFPNNTNGTIPLDSAKFGSGYGPYDEFIQSILGSQPIPTTTMESSSSSSVPWICTGLLGTFTADLYQSSEHHIYYSTNPSTYSTGMFSWFPLYFPSIQPIPIPRNGIIHVDIWRKCNTSIVWYEWLFTVLVRSATKYGTARVDDMNHSMEDDTTSAGNDEYVVTYVSPIHNPGGRSSFVSLT